MASEAGELYDYYTGGRSPQVFFAERPSRSSDWKLRAGKRASEWQFRDAKLMGNTYVLAAEPRIFSGEEDHETQYAVKDFQFGFCTILVPPSLGLTLSRHAEQVSGRRRAATAGSSARARGTTTLSWTTSSGALGC